MNELTNTHMISWYEGNLSGLKGLLGDIDNLETPSAIKVLLVEILTTRIRVIEGELASYKAETPGA